MQPTSHNKILDLTNKASESVMRVTVVELLEDAIALVKEGATPDQLMAFLRGVCTTMEAARTLSMSHTGEDGRIGVPIGAFGLPMAAQPMRDPDEVEEMYQNVAELEEAYITEAKEWERERASLTSTIETLQAQLAQANAPKNGHRTPPVEDTYDDDEFEGEEEVPPQRRRGVGVTSRDRVRGMLATRRSGRGFGRTR